MRRSKPLIPKELRRLKKHLRDYPKRVKAARQTYQTGVRGPRQPQYKTYQDKRAALQALQADRKKTLQRIKDAKAGNLYPPPWIDFEKVDLKTGKGTIGKFATYDTQGRWNHRTGGVVWTTPWTVMQIIDKKNMLIGSNKGQMLWLTDYDTTNWADGQIVPKELGYNVVRIIGTRTYNTAIGGTNTVRVVKIIKIDPLIKAVKAFDKPKPKPKQKQEPKQKPPDPSVE